MNSINDLDFSIPQLIEYRYERFKPELGMHTNFFYFELYKQYRDDYKQSDLNGEEFFENPKTRVIETCYLVNESVVDDDGDFIHFQRVYAPEFSKITHGSSVAFTKKDWNGLHSIAPNDAPVFGVTFDTKKFSYYSGRKEIDSIGGIDDVVSIEGGQSLVDPAGTLNVSFADSSMDFAIDCSLTTDAIKTSIEGQSTLTVSVSKVGYSLEIQATGIELFTNLVIDGFNDVYRVSKATNFLKIEFGLLATDPTGVLKLRGESTIVEGVGDASATGSLSVVYESGYTDRNFTIPDLSLSELEIAQWIASNTQFTQTIHVSKHLYNGDIVVVIDGAIPGGNGMTVHIESVTLNNGSISGFNSQDGIYNASEVGLNTQRAYVGVIWSLISEPTQPPVTLASELELTLSNTSAEIQSYLEGQGATGVSVEKNDNSISIVWSGAGIPAWTVGQPAPTEIEAQNASFYTSKQMFGVNNLHPNVSILSNGLTVLFSQFDEGIKTITTNQTSIRNFEVVNHGLKEGDFVAFWLYSALIARSKVYKIYSSNSFAVLLSDVPGVDFKASHIGNAAFLGAVDQGTRTVPAKIEKEFFIPGVTVGVADFFDIPTIQGGDTPQAQLDALVSGASLMPIGPSSLTQIAAGMYMRETTSIKCDDVFRSGWVAPPDPIDPGGPEYDFTPPLDGFESGFEVGYALFKLTSNYTGSCIFLKKADGQVVEIGFGANGWIDLDAILVHLGNNGVGEIVQWNDQSGNNNHATQSQIGRYPIIRTETDFIYSNGKPSVSFLSGGAFFSFSEVANIRSALWLLDSEDDTTYNSIMGHDSSYDFHCGKDGEWFHTSYSSSHIRGGELFFNNSSVSPTAKRSLNWGVLQLDTTGNVAANQLTEDRNLVRSFTGVMQAACLFSEVKTSYRTDIHDRFVAVMTDSLIN